LNIQPRTLPVEEVAAPTDASSSSIFGGAKPVNTQAREREIEEKQKQREQEISEQQQRLSVSESQDGIAEQNHQLPPQQQRHQQRSHRTSTNSNDDHTRSSNHDQEFQVVGGKQNRQNKHDSNNNSRNSGRSSQNNSFTSPQQHQQRYHDQQPHHRQQPSKNLKLKSNKYDLIINYLFFKKETQSHQVKIHGKRNHQLNCSQISKAKEVKNQIQQDIPVEHQDLAAVIAAQIEAIDVHKIRAIADLIITALVIEEITKISK
jgi:hypothetical protein